MELGVGDRWDVLKTARYWRFCANPARGKGRRDATTAEVSQTLRPQDDNEFTRRARLNWAKLIRRVYEEAAGTAALASRPVGIAGFLGAPLFVGEAGAIT